MATYIKKYAKENGLRRVNAKHNLVLSVTEDDVEKGAAKDSECCAFARSAMKRDKAIKKVFFFKSVAYIETAMTLTRYALPQSVQKEIVSFDRFKTMEPGVYSLSAVPESSSPAAQRAYGLRKKKREGKERNKGGKPPKIRHVTTNVRMGVADK